MKICGIQKVSLLDYSSLISCVIFTQGCNFLCPFCQNANLVIPSCYDKVLDEKEVFSFLESRKGKLDGLVISGGEPTLQKDLISFIKRVKQLGYKVKLDTNGTDPETTRFLIESKLIDYLAMDVKNSLEKYYITSKISSNDMLKVLKTLDILKNSSLEYELRTTLVKEFHTYNDVDGIVQLIKGCKRYYLQNFISSNCVIQKGLHGFNEEELQTFKELFIKKGINTYIRGID